MNIFWRNLILRRVQFTQRPEVETAENKSYVFHIKPFRVKDCLDMKGIPFPMRIKLIAGKNRK